MDYEFRFEDDVHILVRMQFRLAERKWYLTTGIKHFTSREYEFDNYDDAKAAFLDKISMYMDVASY